MHGELKRHARETREELWLLHAIHCVPNGAFRGVVVHANSIALIGDKQGTRGQREKGKWVGEESSMEQWRGGMLGTAPRSTAPRS